jgi:hypothetical protein
MIWDLHDELNDDDDPGKTEVPVEPVELIRESVLLNFERTGGVSYV